MRSALLLFSAPLVAGSLAWAVGMADDRLVNDAPLNTRVSKTQKGKLFYFSRSGKGEKDGKQGNEPETQSARSANLPRTGKQSLIKELTDTKPRTPQRYVRNAPGATAAAPARTETRNYYRELFDEAEPKAVRSAQVQPVAHQAPAAEERTTPAAPEVQTAAHEEPAEAAPQQTDSSSAPPIKKSAVVSATYESQPGETPNEALQQVRHDAPERPAAEGKPAAAPQTDAAESAGADSLKPVAAQKVAAPVEKVAAPAEKAAPSALKSTAAGAKAATPAEKAPAHTEKIASKGSSAAAKPAGTALKAPVSSARTSKTEPAVKAAHHTATTTPGAARQIPSDGAVTQASANVAASAPAAPSLALGSQTPVINLRWEALGEVNVGQECKCCLIAKNDSKVQAMDVVVEAYFPRAVRLLSSDPAPSEATDHLAWDFEQFAAGEEKRIEITMIPARRGDLAANATVRFTGLASAVMKVEDPQLRVAIKGPKEVAVGEAATQVVTISNPGTGVTADVVVQAVVPEGLEHPKGKHVSIAIGSLSPGESRDVRLALSATAGGEQVLVVEAASGSSLIQQAEAQIKVTAPRLDVALSGPGLRYVSRHAAYTVTVTNNGAAANDNVRVVHKIAEGFDFVKADKGGKFDRGHRTVSWFLGRLEAGQAIPLQLELTAKDIGAHVQQVQASGDNGAFAEAKTETRVEGTVALGMEVVDLDDPVEVKSKTAYEIRIRNDGTKAAQNLSLMCALPQGVELIDTEGPSEHSRGEKGTLIFKPLTELGPGKTIIYRVRVAGTTPGNLRFKARLASDSTPDPLIVEELTKFYAD